MLSKDLGELKVIILMFGIIPFFVTSMLSNIKAINPQYYDLCRTLKFNEWETLWEVVIVGKIDQALEVIRQNFAMAWLMITMVEGLDMSGGGIGTQLIKSNRVMHLSEIFAVQLVILGLGIGFDYLLTYLRVWLFPYVKLEQSK
jgi:NitT/TauT family transport system permease protein